MREESRIAFKKNETRAFKEKRVAERRSLKSLLIYFSFLSLLFWFSWIGIWVKHYGEGN